MSTVIPSQPSSAPQRLGLPDADDLDPETVQRQLEVLLLTGGTTHDHALDSGPAEQRQLVRGEGPAADRDERLRQSLGSVAEPLGLSAGEDDRFLRHYT